MHYCTVSIANAGPIDRAIAKAVEGLLDKLTWEGVPIVDDEHEITVHLNVLERSVTAARREITE